MRQGRSTQNGIEPSDLSLNHIQDISAKLNVADRDGVFHYRVKNAGHAGRLALDVKSRLVINALLEQFRFFGVPVFQGLNR